MDRLLCGRECSDGDGADNGVRARAARGGVTALGAFVLTFALLLAGCADDTADTGNVNAARPGANAAGNAPANASAGAAAPKSEAGSIRATPNPVPAGEGNGRTSVSWSTKGDPGVVKVYVSADGQPETLFAQAPEGSLDAPWIQSGVSYEFRLYSEQGGRKQLIDRVQVTRAR